MGHELDTIEGYNNWLFTKEVPLHGSHKRYLHHESSIRQKVPSSDCSYLHSLNLVKMCTLGDYLNDVRFFNAVIDMMGLMQGFVPAPGAIRWVWKHTMQDCPARNYVVEQRGGTLCTLAPETIEFMKED